MAVQSAKGRCILLLQQVLVLLMATGTWKHPDLLLCDQLQLHRMAHGCLQLAQTVSLT